jgi:hypothetical protein
MNLLQEEEIDLTRNENPAEPVARTLEDAAKSLLSLLAQQAHAFCRLAVRRGEDAAAQYHKEVKEIQRFERCYMPYDLQTSKSGKSDVSFKAIWIRKPYVDYYLGPMPATKYKVSKTTHATSLTYISRRCPDSILPVVEETEARLIPIRKELYLATEVLALIRRLRDLYANSEETQG